MLWLQGPVFDLTERSRPLCSVRVTAAVDLWRCGAVSHLIMSGGAVGSPVPEARVMAGLAQAQGVPGHVIVLETVSRNSRENVAMSLSKLSELSDQRVARLILVSDVWHLPRLRMLTCIIGRGMAVSVTHAATLPGEPLRRQWRFFIREVGALVMDSVRGWFV